MVKIFILALLLVLTLNADNNLSFLQKAQDNIITTMGGTDKPNVTTSSMPTQPIQLSKKIQKPQDDQSGFYNAIMKEKSSIAKQQRFTKGVETKFIAIQKTQGSSSSNANSNNKNGNYTKPTQKEILLSGSCRFLKDTKISYQTSFTKYCQSNYGVVMINGELIPEAKKYSVHVKVNFVDFPNGRRMFIDQATSSVTNASGDNDNIATYVNTRAIDKLKKQLISDTADEVVSANKEYQTQKVQSQTSTTTVSNTSGNIVASNTSSPDVLNTIASASINIGAKAIKTIANLRYENLNWLYYIEKDTIFLFHLTLKQGS